MAIDRRFLLLLAALLTSAPAWSESELHIAFGSCLHQQRDLAVLDVIRRQSPDVFVFLGDNVYGDVSDSSLRELKEAYARLGSAPEFLRLRGQLPLLATWDDHDYGLNDGGADFAGRGYSEQLFEQFWGLRSTDEASRHLGVYAAHRLGPDQSVQLLLLDTRSFRSPLVPTDQRDVPGRERYLPNRNPEAALLGEAQWRWLAERLREPAALRILASSIQVLAEGHGWEAWRLFPHERERLYRVLRTSDAGVVIVSGDRHRGGIYRDPDALRYPLFEVTASSLNLPIEGGSEEPGPRRLGATYLGANFGSLRLNQATGQLRLVLHDDQGQVVREVATRLDQLSGG